tara:strand:- start:2817 stop:3146 length:330 start_codon:yes stop_codon:yes gene_type:complete
MEKDLRENANENNAVENKERQSVFWDDTRIKRINSLRLIMDKATNAFFTVGKCTGVLDDGTFVDVRTNLVEIPVVNKHDYDRRYIIDQAREANVFAKGLGVFTAISTVI